MALNSFTKTWGKAFPGLSLELSKAIREKSKAVSNNQYEQTLIENDLYKMALDEKKHEDFVNERTQGKMELYEKAKDSKSVVEKKDNTILSRTGSLADMLRNYGHSLGKDWDSIGDQELIERFIAKNPGQKTDFDDFINGDESDYSFANRMGFIGTNKEKGENFGQKMADFGVGILQSPGKRGYNMIGQWMDKLGKALADKLEGTDLAEAVRDKAIEKYGEDEVRAFAEQRQKELAEGTAFNGRTQTDITIPLLGEERANNGWTKAGEIVGDIGTAVALTYPMGAAFAPIMAESTAGGAALLGGMEGAIDTAFTHYGSQGNFDIKPGEMAIGTALGGLGGVLTNKLANAGKEVVKNTSDKADDVAKITKTTSKIADKTDDANRVAGRIGQGDIDDQSKVVEGVKSITNRSGKEGIKNIKTYKQLEDTIKKTEKQIINEEDDLLRQFPEKIKDWTTTETVKGLGDQVDDVTRDYLDDGIELLKKYNKNDPVAMKELEMLQNTKNTEGLTRLEAKELARKLGSKLSKKFYNSNDELRNSMSAESYEQIRRGIQNAVRDRLPDDVLRNLDIEYSNLKTFEGLTDDMAEKVNTLTQKIKELGPIEKLGRKVGDVVNFVTGKGLKGFVEKFLPSNVGNKINNSIDMEIELSKNLSKLVDLNKAIDTLNNTLNNTASKTAIKTALSKFANSVNTITRGTEATANLIYNSELDK